MKKKNRVGLSDLPLPTPLSLMALLFVLTTGTLSWAVEQSELQGSHVSGVLKKWNVVTVSFDGPRPDELADNLNPFDVKLNCRFTHTEGDSLVAPGFYNGHGQWLVRFAPNRVGTWSWSSRSSITDLDGMSGSIEVAGNDSDNHGALQICKDNPRALCYEDGSPYHLLAFEADWLFALDYGNPGLPKTKHLVNTIADNGFNQIVMNVYAFDASWRKDPNLLPEYNYGGRPNIFPFLGNNENPDYSALNVDFFTHLDGVIEFLARKEIVAHLMIYVWNKQVSWPQENSEADNRYFDYVVKRYQAYPNLVWDISKEALGYGRTDIHYISDRIDRLTALDGHDRLVTVHDYGYCSRFPDKVDFISVQSWKTYLHGIMMNMAAKFPEKPIFNIEHGGYEAGPYRVFPGDLDDPVACLRRNYACVFAGVYSTHYWQGAAWYTVIHDIFENDLTPKPKLHYYKYLSQFLDRIKFNELTATQDNCTSGVCLRNRQKGIYVFYISQDNHSIYVQDLPQAERIDVTWFNPLTGDYSDTEQRVWSKNTRVYKRYSGQDDIAILELIK